MDSKLHVLIAEDSEDDVFILQTALRRAGITNPTQICRNGKEVIDYLKGEGPYSDREKHPFPRVLFIDLKMPVLTGFDVLRWLKGHPDCGVIPTIVLTSSNHARDIEEAYRLGANAYLVKPGRLDEFEKLLSLANSFWTACALPKLMHKC